MGVPATCTAMPVPEVQTQADQLQHPVSGYMWNGYGTRTWGKNTVAPGQGVEGDDDNSSLEVRRDKEMAPDPMLGCCSDCIPEVGRGRHRGGYSRGRGGSVRWSPGSSVS